MIKLNNGLKIYNATGRSITFLDDDGTAYYCEHDNVIDYDTVTSTIEVFSASGVKYNLVAKYYVDTDSGNAQISSILAEGFDVILGTVEMVEAYNQYVCRPVYGKQATLTDRFMVN